MTVPSGTRTDEVVAACAVSLACPAVLARRGAPVGVIAEGEQRRDVAVARTTYVAAVAAVAAVGPTLRDVRLASEGDRARAAVTAAQVALHLVDERRLPHATILAARSVSDRPYDGERRNKS